MNHSSSRSQKKVPTAIRPCIVVPSMCMYAESILHLFFGRMRFFFSLPKSINRLLHQPEWPGTRGNERILKFGCGPTSSC